MWYLAHPVPSASQDHEYLEGQEEVWLGAHKGMVVFLLLLPGGNVYSMSLCFLVRTTQQSILKALMVFPQHGIQGQW